MLTSSAPILASAKLIRFEGAASITATDLIQCVAQQMPSFVSVLPPDDLVQEVLVRINLQVPIGQVRQKAKELQLKARTEKDALLVEINDRMRTIDNI